MSYDVIETLVATKKKQMQPASIVQLEGEIQFTRYLPLEMSMKVEPKFANLQRYVNDFGRCVKRIQDDFILCGYFLNLIKREGLYRYCVEEGLQGYTNFYKFCEEKLGVAQTTAKRLIAINEHFCKNDSKLPEQYKSYGASKLAIMATFENGLEGKLQPSVTVKQLDKLKKYYSSHEWHVDIQTTWRDDLKKFETEQEQNRLLKSARLLQRKFEPAKETDGKPKGLVSDPYKAYTRFFDETLRTVAGLHSNNIRFAPIVQELESVLKRLQGEVLKMQSNDMLDGL